MHEGQTATRDFRPDIQGLRAVAILLVVGYHVGLKPFRAGFVGVDVFFTLSGYLITQLLVAELRETGRIDFVQFYARRARRLLPAASLMLFVVIGVAATLLPPLAQVRIATAARPVSVYAGNYFFRNELANYFAPAVASNPLLHTWSLAVEEQFYLIWPAFVGLSSGKGRSERLLAAMMALLSLISLVAFAFMVRRDFGSAFYGLHARAWEFGVGGLAGLVPATKLGDWGRRSPRLLSASGIAGFAAILAAALRFSENRLFSPAAALAVAGTAVLLTAGSLQPVAGIATFLSQPALQWLGRISYSWYLWHWPMIVFAGSFVRAPGLWERLICAVASLAVASAAYYLAESPIRSSRYLIPRPLLSLALALALMAFGFAGTTVWRRAAIGNPHYERFARVIVDKPIVYQGCLLTRQESRPRECVFGNPQSDAVIVLFGDSHAAQWFTPIEALVRRRSWRLVTQLKSSCPAVPPSGASQPVGNADNCAAWQKAALQRIVALAPSLIIMGSAGQEYAGPPGSGRRYSYDEWRDATRATLEVFHSGHLRTMLLRDTPRPGFDVLTCLAGIAWGRKVNCSLSRTEALDETLFRAEKDAANGIADVTVADLSDEICGPQICDAEDQGRVVYRDSHHLANSFAATKIEALSNRIDSSMQISRLEHDNSAHDKMLPDQSPNGSGKSESSRHH